MRNDNCTTCGGFGYTIDTDHTMTGCHECFVAAHEADQCSEDDRGHEYEFAAHRCTHCNQLHPSVLVLGKGETRIDVRKEAPRGVAYTFGGLS